MTDSERIWEPGIYRDVPFAEYRAIPAFHYSGVKPMLRSALHYQLAERDSQSTKAQQLGSLLDTMLLEPEQMDRRFILQPETYVNSKGEEKPWTNLSKTCRQWTAKQVASGLTVVTSTDFDATRAMVSAVRGHPAASEVFETSRTQVTLVWEAVAIVEKDIRVLCKMRMDLFDEDALRVVDLKKTRCAAPGAFSRDVNNFGYHIQGACYCAGIEAHFGQRPSYDILAVESESPYPVNVFALSADALQIGRMAWERALRLYAECLHAQQWDLYSSGTYSKYVEELTLPAWALRRGLDDGELDNEAF